MNWAYFKACFHQQAELLQSGSSLHSSKLWVTSSLQVSLNKRLTTCTISGQKAPFSSDYQLELKAVKCGPRSCILLLPTTREKIGIKYNYIPLQILLLFKQSGERTVQFSPLITPWEILSWCSTTQRDWSTQQINFIPGIMYTLSWEKISLNIRRLCMSQPT